MKSLVMLIILCILLGAVRTSAQDEGLKIGYGDQREGELSASESEGVYRFQGAQGDSITITVNALEGSLDPLLILLDSARQQVLALDDNNGGGRDARLRFVLPADGIYVITVTMAPGSGVGRYRLGLNLNNPTPIPVGAISTPLIAPILPDVPASGRLDSASGIALYALKGTGNSAIRVELAADLGLEASLSLFADDLRTRLASGEGTVLTAILPGDGVFFVVVSRVKGEGSISLKADYTPLIDAPLPDLPVLIPGQSVAGVIDLDFARTFRFAGDQGSAVRFDLDFTEGLEVIAVLADASFHQIAVSAGSLARVLLPSTGTYYVMVMRRAGVADPQSGSFSLTLSGAPPEVPLQPIAFGQSLNGEINDSRYRVEYVIRAAAGEGIVIHLEATSGSQLDPLVLLLDSNGAILGRNDDRAPGLVNASLPYQFSESGRYVVVATRQGEATGKSSGGYRLQIERRSAPEPTPAPAATGSEAGTPAVTPGPNGPDLQAIAYGDSLSGTITDGNPLRYYVFQGASGDQVEIRLSQSSGYSLDPLLYLYLYQEGAQPTLLGGNDDLADGVEGEAGLSLTLPHTGSYLIVATRKGAAAGATVGNFVLFLRKLN